MMLKIISGGQTGADQAALDAAIKLGLPHGGWIPKGRKTEAGLLPKIYHLRETSTSHYSQRTEQNVIEADGTLIVSHGGLSGGTAYCRTIAIKQGKPWLHIDLNQSAAFLAAVSVKKWIVENGIQTVNVSGPRASRDPLIYKAVFGLIETIHYLLQIERLPPNRTLPNRTQSQDNPTKWPGTVDEAIEQLMKRISLKDRTYIANMFESELISLDYTLGRYIRDHFGLWGENQNLIDDCRKIKADLSADPEIIAAIIIKSLWLQLRKTHRLRLIK